MGYLYPSIVAIAVAIGAIYLPDIMLPKLPPNFGGHVEPKFQRVEKAFHGNFHGGHEGHGGAAFAAYYKGKLVVDLWGGYADDTAMRTWNRDTMSCFFSTTKGVAAIAIAMLVERGHLNYGDLVSKYWPDFAQNGKANVTVQMIMDHTAGLPVFEQPVSYSQSSEEIAKILASQKPKWPPGTKTGYHPMTYGWLVDQLVRRSDPESRSIGQFVREEITQKTDPEFYIGVPHEYHSKVARLFPQSFLGLMQEVLENPKLINFLLILIKPSPLIIDALSNPGVIVGSRIRFNDPSLYSVEQAAALGIGTARGAAKIYSDLVMGRLLNEKSLQMIRRPNYINQIDVLTEWPIPKGWGFQQTPHPKKAGDWLVGHPGHGCQNAKGDLDNQLSFAYVTNTIKLGLGDRCGTFIALQQALYASLVE